LCYNITIISYYRTHKGDFLTRERNEGMICKSVLEIDQDLSEKIQVLSDKVGLDINSFLYKLLEKNVEFDAFNLADSISDGIYVIDKQGIVTSINRGFTRITGFSEDEVLGKHMQDVWKEKGIEDDGTLMVEAQIKDLMDVDMISKKNKKNFSVRKPRAIALIVLEEKKKISIITTIKRNNKTVLIVGTPYFDEYGEVSQVITIIRDLTELIELNRKLAEAEAEKRKYFKELNYLKGSQGKQVYNELVGTSPSMEKVKKLISSVAQTDATVLITGETGTGKEVVATEVYKNSKRIDGPYVKINCAAIPETLLESELFGYEKGAFTGAQNKEKLGLFEIANNGTILLDEIGEMPIKLQSKLLRVLQEREIKRIGGTKSIKIDVRVIAATNQSLLEQIKKGEFREDLYYRLNVIPIVVPPLRERKEDITVLVYNFLDKFNSKYGKNRYINIDTIETLKSYDWPGNVRELENTIERLVVIGDDEFITNKAIVSIIGEERFSHDLLTENNDTTLKEAVDLFEKNIIEKALKKHGSTYKAAKVLGITQSTVVRKAQALGIKEW
jgi:transcriptional regulator with PAS, ATPase and Fis domain